jgi:hypothetical protein
VCERERDLPPTINILLEPILFTDDTNVIISSKNFDDFSTISKTFLSYMNKWFVSNKLVLKWFISNKLVLNLDKTNKKSVTNKPPQYYLNIDYDEEYIEESNIWSTN